MRGETGIEEERAGYLLRQSHFHGLHIPERRSQTIDIIEDVIPLHDIDISIRVPEAVTGVTCVPEALAVPYRQVGDRVEFTLPRLVGHQMIALNF